MDIIILTNFTHASTLGVAIMAENIAGAFYFAARVVNVSTKAAQAAAVLACGRLGTLLLCASS
ncbi:hypothetical protein [Pseudoalteromonas rubra]|uniref:Uncharacterized protein n=1 Tax=Pseudoalteromonas rubra TaxID=43658 RepID=A0A5S3WWN4_9GAMM|nr:hypothetical protein [Pseudoalteromonas rubra]TMP35479.1 hypothetical protein CWB98_15795 [Pseudoalteromonas rubra]